MAKYFRDWTEDAVGNQPTGWVEGEDPADAQWLIASDAGGTNGVVLRATKTGGTSGDTWASLVWSALASQTDYEIAGYFRYTALFNVQTAPGWVSAKTASVFTGYFASVASAGTRSVFRQTNFVSSAPVGADLATAAGAALTRGTWYGFRLRRVAGNLKMRLWDRGGAEPGAWDIDATDGSPLAAGYPAISALFWPAGDPARTYDFDLVGVTTSPATESAPLANVVPATPTVTVSSGGASGVQITGSAFSSPISGNTHAHSQFRVLRASDSAVIYDSGSVAPSVGPQSASGLTSGVAYTAQMRYQDQRGDWSAYGSSAGFTIPPIRMRVSAAGAVQVLGASTVDPPPGRCCASTLTAP